MTRELTVDVGILGFAAGSQLPHCNECRGLLNTLKSHPDGQIVIDDEGLIRHQYDTKLGPLSFGREWVRFMLERGKFSKVHRARIPEGVRVDLEEAHFDREDYKVYVRTAAASVSRRIVTYDDDYSPEVRRILRGREVRIEVHDSLQAEEFVRMCPDCRGGSLGSSASGTSSVGPPPRQDQTRG